ncbi:MAG: LON peptidase substrate-binding domain-containing protein [Actinomycetota bacterium]|nr:LON peptidase substrate-binding domain-containing protein [Actinomycetota bacterium]
MPSVPLFPLGTALLPGARLPLQIFEERYVALLRHIIDSGGQESGFGVVGIRHGWEVGDQLTALHEIGCWATLDRVIELTDELYLATAHGTRRFRLDAVDEDAGTPWTTGIVEWLDDRDDDPDRAAREAAQLTLAVESHCRAAGVATPDAPRDARGLAWWAAEAVDLDRGDRQRLLETSGTADRLALVRRMVQRETGLASRLGVEGIQHSAPPNLN